MQQNKSRTQIEKEKFVKQRYQSLTSQPLGVDRSLVPTFGQNLLRQMHKNGLTPTDQVNDTIQLIANIGQILFQSYNKQIKSIQNEILYKMNNCECQMKQLQTVLLKYQKVKSLENKSALQTMHKISKKLLCEKSSILLIRNQLKSLKRKRQAVCPILLSLLQSFHQALERLNQMDQQDGINPKIQSYSDQCYYYRSKHILAENLINDNKNYILNLELILRTFYSFKFSGKQEKNIIENLGASQDSIVEQLFISSLMSQSQPLLRQLHQLIERGILHNERNQGIVINCFFCENWTNQLNDEVDQYQRIDVAKSRVNYLEKLENLRELKSPMVIVTECSISKVLFNIVTASNVTRLFITKSTLPYGAWALFISLVSKLSRLQYLSIIDCNAKESVRYFAKSDILVPLASSSILQYLNLSFTHFSHPLVAPVPNMCQNEIAFRHPINSLFKVMSQLTSVASLRHLNISGQNISNINGGLKCFLQKCDTCNLERLVMSHNNLGEEGSGYLGDSLQKNNHLVYLDISYNNITWIGFLAFTIASNGNNKLEFLNLNGNLIEYPRHSSSGNNNQNYHLIEEKSVINKLEGLKSLQIMSMKQNPISNGEGFTYVSSQAKTENEMANLSLKSKILTDADFKKKGK